MGYRQRQASPLRTGDFSLSILNDRLLAGKVEADNLQALQAAVVITDVGERRRVEMAAYVGLEGADSNVGVALLE
jgi:hypothetical protein